MTVCCRCLSQGAKFPDKEMRQVSRWKAPLTNAEAVRTGMLFD